MNIQVQPSRAAELEQPVHADAPPRRRWRDLPLRSRTTVLILLAAMGGLAAGMVESASGHRGWPLLILITVAIGGPLYVAGRSIWQPVERLLEDTRHAWRAQRPTRHRPRRNEGEDEIAQLARLVHQHTLRAYRQARAADHLRRTLDHRVKRATRAATRHLQQIAMRDPLTGLGNRRFLDVHLGPLVQTCRSSDTDLICLVLDLDHFKPINDTLGHAAGDRLLKFLAQLIHGNLRRDDLAIRLGGDEFLILMPGTEMRNAADFARRLRELFGQHVRTTLPRNLATGISIGLASLQHDQPPSGAALIQQADHRLYTAKEARNEYPAD